MAATLATDSCMNHHFTEVYKFNHLILDQHDIYKINFVVLSLGFLGVAFTVSSSVVSRQVPYELDPTDILLGADVFGEIMLNRHLNVEGQSLTAMESIFGWVVLGKTKLSCQRIISNHASYNAVEFQLDKFWQLEELGETKPFTNEEIACENHFERTHTRDSTGRFAVNFPFRDSSDELGSFRDTPCIIFSKMNVDLVKTNHFPINITDS
ncbi:uncharacterized protein LOC103569155 [Trichonephila clavipes]|uniref:Uncharacterized protein LOC103569155, partial n=1 Tax=Trichonephila clavipes TaxID=2585209 RepID=A0A8X6SGR7_TRICX|nr:uncharacterized protein LOC103569155 [Trichonephila clavipes]